MGTVDELGHAEESKDENQQRGDTPVVPDVAPAKPAAPARQGDPTGASRTSADFQPSVNNRAKWVATGRR